MKNTSVAACLFLAAAKEYEDALTFEIVPTDPAQLPAAMVRMLSTSDPVVRAYRCGDCIARQRWAVCYRVNVHSDEQRADAVAAIEQLAQVACDAVPELPAGCEFYQTTTTDVPTLIEATSDYETWQVSLETTYKRIRLR